MMTKRFVKSLLLAASAMALCAGGAHATDFTLDLTGDVTMAGFFDNTSPGFHTVGASLNLTGLDDTNAFTANIGDHINGTLHFINGTLTLIPGGSFSTAAIFTTGGFDQDTEVKATLFKFLLGGVVVDEGGSTAETRTDLVISGFFGANHPAITFDEIDFESVITSLGSPNAEPIVPGMPTRQNGALFSMQSITISDVPEPASWALMITGFGLAGASLRRRRSVAAA